jgi:YVTN family beta-propeller protein
MKFSHSAAGACVAVLCILVSGCGDVFRPVATPLPLPSPDPQTFRLAVFTSCAFDSTANSCSAGNTTPTGASTDVDVSGDTLAGVTPVGRSPIFALVEASQVVTADRDTDTVTDYSHFSLGTSTSISAPTTIGLPSGAKPSSLADASGSIYVAESGRNVVGVLGGAPLALTTEIPVGANPVNLAALPNAKKVYVVNQGSDSVTVISAADKSVLATIPLAAGSSPVWAVASADSTRLYVVNRGLNNVTVVDATSDAAMATVSVGNAPNYAIFDAHNQRVLVTNPGSNTLSVIKPDPTSPQFTNVTNIAVGTTPVSVTALADGTRVYVANQGSNSVSVINSLSLAVTKTISLVSASVIVGSNLQSDPNPHPVWIASDGQSSKVFTANRDAGDVSVILTSTDSELTDATTGKPVRLSAPLDPSCSATSSTTCVRLNPVFVGVGPG